MSDTPDFRLPRGPDGDPELRRIGIPRDGWRDIYYFVLVQNWVVFYALIVAFYVLVNCGFATLYWLQPGCIGEAHPGNWLEDFFFSFETLATVGYGAQHPQTLYAHWVVVIEITAAVLTVPFATGLVILKFARPYARVTFSRNAVIAPFDGVPTLIFRLANLRDNQIFQAHINLTLVRAEITREGRMIRRLIKLEPLREMHPMFILSWTVMHRIDAASPLYGLDWSALQPGELNITAVMTGLDATTSATIHARHFYESDDILFDHMFDDIIFTDAKGQITIDYRRLNAVSKLGPA